jgi:hypothetical protein
MDIGLRPAVAGGGRALHRVGSWPAERQTLERRLTAQAAALPDGLRLVLSHLTQAGLPFYTLEAFTKGMDAGGPLDWRLARDGMTIDLPAGGSEIRFGQF